MKIRPIKTVGIVSKSNIAEKAKFLSDVVKAVGNRKILLDNHSAPLINKTKGYSREEIFKKSDLVITLGGDGTVLKSAACVHKKITPVFAVNLGNLGFLTTSTPSKAINELKHILKGDFHIEKRSLLRVTRYRSNKKLDTFLALNDMVINQGQFARLIELDIEVDDKRAVKFKADGMIISTPTGSTAHGLSAGGPIVHPTLDAFIMTAICPSTLSMRPVVLPNNKKISIKIATERRGDYNLGMTLDGQITVPLEYGDRINIRKSSRHFYLAAVGAPDYFQLLREKLGWG